MISFSDLYQRYARDVYRFALYLSGNPGYLLTIARNLYLKECRQRARATELSDAIASPSADLELAAAQKERLGPVLRALQELPEVDRSALLLRADDGLLYQQIAAVLGLSLASVKVKIHRARLKLAEIGA
jgi:RNA polymerase sigma-70 factor, ECF subfamily